MGLAPEHVGADPDLAQQFDHPLLALRPVQIGVDPQGLSDHLENVLARVERRVGILEDHLHSLPLAAQLRPAQGRDVGAVELDAPTAGFDEAGDQAGQGRLARPALADQPERRPGGDAELHAVDGVDRPRYPLQQAGPQRELLGQALDHQECRALRRVRRLRRAAAAASSVGGSAMRAHRPT